MTSQTMIDEKSISNFSWLIKDLQEATGRSAADAVAYAGGKFLQSCSATAKPGKKLRKVISNPLFKAADSSSEARSAARGAKADMRRARFGVMKYSQKKEPKFVPIYRTGEFGRTRFIDKKTGQIRVRSDKGKLISETNFDQGLEGAPSIKNDKRRMIKNAGLARKVFRIMRAQLLAGSTAINSTGEHYSISTTFRLSGKKHDTVLDLYSMLTYLTNAYPNILQSSSAAAMKGLEYELKNQIAKRTAQAMQRRRSAA